MFHASGSAVRVSITLPGARNDLDVRVCVTLEPEELPWPIRFYFLRTEEGPWQNVGVELGIGPVRRDAIEQLDGDRAQITPSAVRWIQENLFHYRARAESELNTERVVPRKGGGNSPEALAYLAAQYRELGGARGAVKYLAEVHGCSRTTMWRRLKRAGVKT
jgi:hypothetical protein